MIVAGFAERKEEKENKNNSVISSVAMTGKWFWTAVAVGMLLVASSTGVRAEEEDDELKTETVDGDLGAAREGSR